MPWQTTIQYLINQPVGVSLADGTGVSGILCSINHKEIYLLEYLYHTQFVLKHYPLNLIRINEHCLNSVFRQRIEE